VPDEKADAPVVICSELPTDLGTSTTNAARIIAGEVAHHLKRLVWIEHYPPEAASEPKRSLW